MTVETGPQREQKKSKGMAVPRNSSKPLIHKPRSKCQGKM